MHDSKHIAWSSLTCTLSYKNFTWVKRCTQYCRAVSAWTDWCTGKCAAIQHSLNNLRNGILAKLAQAATTPRSKQVGPRSFHNRQLVMTQQYTRDRQPRKQFESSRRTHMTRRCYHMSGYETGTFFDTYLRPNACCTCVLGLVPWWWERELSRKMISVLLQACFDHKITAWSISINAICKDIGKWVNWQKNRWFIQSILVWALFELSAKVKKKECVKKKKKRTLPQTAIVKTDFGDRACQSNEMTCRIHEWTLMLDLSAP